MVDPVSLGKIWFLFRSRDIFQEALKNSELVLRVLPCTGENSRGASFINDSNRPAREVGGHTPAGNIEKLAGDPAYHSGRGREAGSSKPAPPPPPRRSPHTALTQQQRQQGEEASAKAAPVLPPRQKQDLEQPRNSLSVASTETKTVRLRKGEAVYEEDVHKNG